MKIPNRVQFIYDDLHPSFLLLKDDVDTLLAEDIKTNGWFYRSRLKKIESFYQKLELNIGYHSGSFEDFLGCEIVVDSREQIDLATDCLKKYFTIEYQRPKNVKETNLSPDSFRFSDLRLYLKRKHSSGIPEKPFHRLKFELQIKTIFSYAWAKATHSLVYKGKEISWAKQRVSFQIKAMLEQSEYAISNIENTNDTFFPSHTKFDVLKKTSELFKERWDTSLLPSDLKRSSENIVALAEVLNISFDAVYDILSQKLTPDFILKHRNISPFFATLVALEDATKDFVKINRNTKDQRKFLLVDEVEEYLSDEYLANLKKNNYVYQM